MSHKCGPIRWPDSQRVRVESCQGYAYAPDPLSIANDAAQLRCGYVSKSASQKAPLIRARAIIFILLSTHFEALQSPRPAAERIQFAQSLEQILCFLFVGSIFLAHIGT
jgi:hypothetical protein